MCRVQQILAPRNKSDALQRIVERYRKMIARGNIPPGKHHITEHFGPGVLRAAASVRPKEWACPLKRTGHSQAKGKGCAGVKAPLPLGF